MSLLYADLLFLGIYYEDSIRDLLHIFDTADVLLKFLKLFKKACNLFLGKNVECSVLLHLLDLFETSDTSLNSLEVCKHTTEPSLVYEELSATLSLSFDCILCLFLCTNEEDSSSVSYDISNCTVSVVNHSYGFLKVDDVDSVTLCVDVRSHLRVPSSCEVTEMYTGFE